MTPAHGGYPEWVDETTQPPPPEDPEEEGIPDYAVDTSTAYDEADRPRFEDSPPPLPADRPQAVDDFGVTASEAREGEPLDDRLERERPDVPRRPQYTAGNTELADEVVTEQTEAQAREDAEVLGTEPEPEPAAGPSAAWDKVPRGGEPVGRLVEPDAGVPPDTEKDLVATDEGEAGGGLSAEEAAMYEVPEDELPD